MQSVQEIYTYYKKFDYQTEVMGASFRNVGQILELAGCDLLTISPELMKELSESYEPVERKLGPEKAKKRDIERLELDEKKFRYLVQRRRDGDGENRRRNSQVRGRHRETGEVRREQAVGSKREFQAANPHRHRRQL